MLTQRLSYGALLIAGLVGIFWLDLELSSGDGAALNYGSVIPLCVVILAMTGLYEAYQLTRSAGYEPMGWVLVAGVVAVTVLPWLVPVIQTQSRFSALEWQFFAVMLCGLLIGVVQVFRRRTERGIGDIAVSLFLLFYMGVLPSCIIALRSALPGSDGAWAVLLFVAVVKLTDIGAYFTGIAIGRTPLIPQVSPAKTVEGLAGGVVWAIVVSCLLCRYLPWSELIGVEPISMVQAVVFGILMAVTGQLGDLVESVMKRDATSKDSGRVIPAFGGILDLLDSPAFAAPVGYLLLGAWLSPFSG